MSATDAEQPVTDASAAVARAARPVPAQLGRETGYLLRLAHVRVGDLVASELPTGIPQRYHQVLQSLSDLGPRSQHELCELLHVNRTTMVELIDAMEHADLVTRRRNPSDRRSYALQPTPTGQQMLQRLTEAVDRADAQLTATLSERERQRLQTLLEAIASADEQLHELPAGLVKLTGEVLSLAHLRVRELTNEALKAAGLVTPLYGTLTTLDASGPASQQAIAERLGLSGTAILKTVDRLEADGLVKRRRDPTDRRAYALELTPAGHATLQRARAAITEINGHLDTILGGEAHQHELQRLLHKLLEPRP